VDASVLAAIREAEAKMQQGQRTLALAESEETQDLARAQALDEAAEALRDAQQTADTAYERASREFGELESLRRDAYDALQSADTTIRSAAAFMQEQRGVVSAAVVDQLQSAINSMPTWRDEADAEHLRAVKLAAQEAEQQAESAREMAEDEARRYSERQASQQAQDLLGTLLAIGASSLMSGSGRRRHGGWGGGVFGGSTGSSRSGQSGGSGGGWGLGGSDSGSWVGGGSDSGSWGGGGSAGGSWGRGGSDSGGW
jgi:hypothetical protein